MHITHHLLCLVIYKLIRGTLVRRVSIITKCAEKLILPIPIELEARKEQRTENKKENRTSIMLNARFSSKKDWSQFCLKYLNQQQTTNFHCIDTGVVASLVLMIEI